MISFVYFFFFFFSSRRRHTRFDCDWSSDVCSSDLARSAHLPPFAINRRIENCLPQGTPAIRACQCRDRDRKSTRLNSSHSQISYAVFCLKKKKKRNIKILISHK